MATINGTNGNDTSQGTTSVDAINGLAGNDLIFGNLGNDTVLAGAGVDRAYGGSGNDLLDSRNTADGDLLVGDGFDTLAAFQSNGPRVAAPGADTIFGSSGKDTIYGDNADASSPSSGGADIISGGSGGDTIFGEGGNDRIAGEAGTDTIDGGQGDDQISGGAAWDQLTGGAGADTFAYAATATSSDSSTTATDVITDFQQSVDKIDLRALLGATDLVWGGTTPTANGVWFQQSGGRTYVFADVTGNTTPELRIQLNGLYALTPSDFLGVQATQSLSLTNDAAAAAEDSILVASGNVLTNDGTAGVTVTGVRFGGTVGTVGTSLAGEYGSLRLNSDGTYTYTLNNADADVQALAVGATVRDVFSYTGTAGSQSGTASLTVTIDGSNDSPRLTTATEGYLTRQGVLSPPLPAGSSRFDDAVQLPDGKLLFVGDVAGDLFLARTNVDGALDVSFGNGSGVATVDVGASVGFFSATTIVPLSGGKFAVICSAGSQGVLLRFNSDGTRDGSFSGDGMVTASGSPVALGTMSDGKVVLATHAGETLSFTRYGTDGAIDTAFGSGGTATLSLAAIDNGILIEDFVQQPDGKLVLVGSRYSAGGAYDIFAVRLTLDGAFDTTFGGGDGWISTNTGPGLSFERGYGATLQADGKLVIAGLSFGGDGDFAVVRYLPDGSLDTTFGQGDGVSVIDFAPRATYDRGLDVVQLANGKLVVAGEVGTASGGSDFGLARLNADGSLDATFGTAGLTTVPVGPGRISDTITSLIRLADGGFVIAGWSDIAFGTAAAALRFSSNGALDTAFGAGGMPDVVADEGMQWSTTLPSNLFKDVDGDSLTFAATLADGSPLPAWLVFDPATRTFSGVAPQYSPNLTVRVSVSDGSGGVADDSFMILTNAPPVPSAFGSVFRIGSGSSAGGIAVQPDGDIVVAGSAVVMVGEWFDDTYEHYTALTRFDSDLTVDAQFAEGGTVLQDLDPGFNGEFARDVVRQADGRFVLAATANGAVALLRYNSDGSLDTGFGVGGIVRPEFGSGIDQTNISTVAQLGDGKLVGVGAAWADGIQQFIVCRFATDGALDPAFGGGAGFVTTSFGGGSVDAQALQVAEQDDGRLVVVGVVSTATGGQEFALARYNIDGSLDAGFGGGDGLVITSVGPLATHDVPRSVFAQPDGKILVGGAVYLEASGTALALVRYNADGSLDATFGGGDGIVITEFSLPDRDVYVSKLVQQADGRFLVVGDAMFPDSMQGDLLLARINADGSLDSTFGGGDGIATVGAYGPSDIDFRYTSGIDVVQQADGDLVVVGNASWMQPYPYSTSGVVLARFSADGALKLLDDHSIASGVPFSMPVPATLFADPDEGEVRIDVRLANGSALPAWLSFDPSSHVLSGTPPAGVGSLSLIAVGTDDLGSQVSLPFRLVGNAPPTDIDWVSAGSIATAPLAPQTLASLQAADPDDAVGSVAFAADPGSAPGFAVSSSGVLSTTLPAVPNSSNALFIRATDAAGATYVERFDVVFGGNGADALLPSGGAADSVLAGDDAVYGFAGNDVAYGGSGRDVVDGGDGDDDLDAGSDGDIVLGGAGLDDLIGGSGTDILLPGGGADRAYGGSGNDRLDSRDTVDADLLVGDGFESLAALNSGGTRATSFGDDEIYGGAGKDVIYGDNADSSTTSAGGRDLIFGGAGSDRLFGEGGDDSIFGDAGSDTIDGGAGNDAISGGVAWDQLTGGSGADVFVYAASAVSSDSTATSTDVITDFVRGQDRLNLQQLLGATDVTWGGSSPTANGVWFQQSGGNTLVFADVTGDLTPELRIQLNGLHALAATDFMGIVGGVDTLVGTPGDDRFVFSNGSGNDRIVGFTAGIGAGDVIDLSQVTNPDWTSFADVQAALSQSGTDAVINMGNGNTITLVGVAATALLPSDFQL